MPLIVDNTVATPILCRPFEHGAGMVVHSLTKYIGGHGTSIGGIVVDSGQFPWAEHRARFPLLNSPDPSYPGVTYTEAFGPAAFIGRCRVVPLRNTGAALSPFNAFLTLQGLETLALRMERHCANALQVAEFLQQHPQISWVKYAGLVDHPEHELAQRYMGGQPAAILSFGIQGNQDAGARFIDALQLVVRLVNIGDAKSLACHPASPPPPPAQRRGAGQGRRAARHGAPVDWHRTYRRHPRRLDSGAGSFPLLTAVRRVRHAHLRLCALMRTAYPTLPP